jgi:hypothetical protein
MKRPSYAKYRKSYVKQDGRMVMSWDTYNRLYYHNHRRPWWYRLIIKLSGGAI